MRFVRILVFVIVAAGVLAGTAAAFRFTDASYNTPEGEVGEAYYHKFETAGGTPPATFTVINGSLPPGLSLSSDGVLSGVAATAGSFSFWLNARDNFASAPMNAQREFTINIAPRLVVTTESIPAGTVGAGYGVQLNANGGGTQTWSIQSGTLPPGVAFDPVAHTIAGTPTTAGDYSFVVFVKDPKRSDTKGLTLSVRAPLAITQPEFASAEVGAPFSGEIEVTGGLNISTSTAALLSRVRAAGRAAYTLTVAGLPRGLVADANGAISGTPTVAGSFPITINAADPEGRTATLTARLVVSPKLAITTRRLAGAKAGKLYRVAIKTRGGVAPLKWGKITGKLPIGIRFDRRTGVLSGTAKKDGTYTVTVKVSDGLKVSAEQVLSFTLTGGAKLKKAT
jgi:hypothetical protein